MHADHCNGEKLLKLVDRNQIYCKHKNGPVFYGPLCISVRSCITLMVSLELPGESVDVLQTLAFDLRWSSLTTLLKQAVQGLFILSSTTLCSCCSVAEWPSAGSGVVRIDPFLFLAGCRTRRLNQVCRIS